MIWPNATDYNAAVQNPQLCFRDEDLRQGQAVGDLFGLPRPHSGNFADVYQIQGDGQSWAVKCFTRPVAGLRPRYQAITEHLRQTQRAFMVDFCYLDEGIRIRDHWYPLVKMRWIEGLRLNEFIGEQLSKPVLLERLGQLWLRLAQELRDAGMAHGDLQHGNVLLVPGSKSMSLSLKLIDYDGMFVPSLADCPSGEVGHPNYQHPQRLRAGGYDREMDRFSQLLIYTTLRCLRVGGLDLWQRYDSLENLLFREEDFRQPGKSRLLRELWELKDRDSRQLVGHLLLASQGPLLVVPSLDELVDDNDIRPLSDSEERQINALLESSAVKSPASGGRQPPGAVQQVAVHQGANAPRSPTSVTAVLVAAPTVETAALNETLPIALQAPPPLSRRRTAVEIDRDAQPAETSAQPDKPFDAAALVDPLVSILSRPVWLAALGVFALVSFLVVNLLVWSSVKKPEAAPAKTPRLPSAHVDEVVIKEAPDLEKPKPRMAQPILEPPENIVCFRGRSTTFPFRVRRNDCREPLSVQFEDLPPEVRQESAPSAEGDTLSVTVSVADNLPAQSMAVILLLRVGDAVADTRALLLDIKEDTVAGAQTPPVRLKRNQIPDAVAVEAGKDGELSVSLARHGYRGKVETRLEGLPAGARAAPVFSELADANLRIETTEKTEPGKYAVKLLLRVDEKTLDERVLFLTVRRPRGRQETVHFHTVDHMQLTGTLYHGWKGKKGMTVLMLHDLGHDRRSPGWKHLAESLQDEGHTVLTFDFRGHGDSKKVTPEFWKFPVNRFLPLHNPIKPADQQPTTLDATRLPGEYSPWLIHDIAAARTYLDLQHDHADGPVNTFNMVLIGAGQGSALGSLWLATEGVRFNAADVDGKIELKLPEKLSVLQAFWIGMEEKLNGHRSPVRKWIALSRSAPVVPLTFLYGAGDAETERVVDVLPRELQIVPETGHLGQSLLDREEAAAQYVQRYLAKTLQQLPPPPYTRRDIKKLHSYWAFPVEMPSAAPAGRQAVHLFTAKRPGETVLQYVPLERFDVPIKGPLKGMVERPPIPDWIQR